MKNKITIPCNKKQLTYIRQFAFNFLIANTVPEFEARNLVLAVDEICSNIIIHANKCDPKNKIQLSIHFRPNKIIFTFKDQGTEFDINEYEVPTVNKVVSSGRKGGYGLILVKKIMDKIEVSTENNYNICKLIKIYP